MKKFEVEVKQVPIPHQAVMAIIIMGFGRLVQLAYDRMTVPKS